MNAKTSACILALLLIATAECPAQQDRTIRAGNWGGRALFEDGKFRRCVFMAPNSGGTFLAVVAAPNPDRSWGGPERKWGVIIMHPSWHVEPGKVVPFDVTLDGQARFHVYGAFDDETQGATHFSGVVIDMPGPVIERQFFQSKTMDIVIQGQPYHFSLNGVGLLPPLLQRCVRENMTPETAD